jgi:predicted permease
MGIGANTAVFSVLDAVVLKPLPYPHAGDLVGVWHTAPGAPGLTTVSGDLRLSASMYFTYREQNRTFEHLGIWFPMTATVTGLAEPEEVRTVGVSDGVLQALAVPPLLGRWLSADDQAPTAAQTVVLGYGYWQRRLGGDRTAIGRSLTVDGTPRTIVGVMPRGFAVVSADLDLILPAQFDRSRLVLPGFGFLAVARLEPGMTIADANADIARMVPLWIESWPMPSGINPHIYDGWRITPAVRPLKHDVVGSVRQSLWVLMTAIGIVMLIACANVATLILVRAEGRHQELAIRTALGAGAGRLARALLIESLLLGTLGGGLGLGLAAVALRLLVANGPAMLPRLGEIAIEARSVLFTAGVSIVSSALVGLLPALRQSSTRIGASLSGGSGRTHSESRHRHRVRRSLVVAQIALALMLLVSAGLMIRTFQALHGVEPGFTRPAQLQTLRLSIPNALVPAPERVAQLQKAIVETLAAIPGVEAVGFASAMPLEGIPPNWDAIFAETIAYGAGETPAFRVFMPVSPGFFQTAGTRLIAGRDYTWADMNEHRAYAIVSENLAREFWGTPAAAIGERIRTLPSAPWREVIGVVQDTYDNGVQQPAPAKVYWPAIGDSPYRPIPTVTRSVTVILRTARAGTDSLINEAQRAVWSVNANLSVASVRTMQEVYDRSMARTSFTLVMLTIAGAMALVLGIVGIYGVIAYAVSQRTREMGIRLALGAQRGDLTRMFVRAGLILVAAGVPIGLVASAGLTRVMSSLLYGVSPMDPATYLAVPLVLVAAAVAASYMPARRAARVDPADALKVG